MKRVVNKQAKEITNRANEEIAIEILRNLSDAQLGLLDNALSRNEALTSSYTLSFTYLRVYKEGWYLMLEGTRAGYNVFAYDDDGEIRVANRKPPESKLNFLYQANGVLDRKGERFWYDITERVRQ